MNSVLFIAGGSARRKGDSRFNRCETLDWTTKDAPIKVEFLDQKLVETFPPAAQDLLEIAYSVYAADRIATRSGDDLRGDQWRRAITIRIPVRDKRWVAPNTVALLTSLLDFLTDDHWTFEFAPFGRTTRSQQSIAGPLVTNRTCISLFSGGLDSLAGAAWDCHRGHRPLLLSHRSNVVTGKRQRELFQALVERSSDLQHLPFWVQLRNDPGRESAQRSRTFLFLAAAAVVARQYGVPVVHVFENGIVSINLPVAFQVVGSRASRTTHPQVIGKMQALVEATLGPGTLFELPFFQLTKSDVVHRLRESGCSDLLARTSSCTHTRFQTAALQHCGVCSQCVDRRFGVEAAGVGAEDRTYVHDVFTGSMARMPREAEARGLIEGYLRRYLEMAQFNDADFVARYANEVTDLYDYIPDNELAALPSFYRRHAAELQSVIEEQIRTHAAEFARGSLPNDCVLQVLVRDQALAHGPQERYAERVANVARDIWRVIFSGRSPSSEDELQRELEGAMAVAQVEVEREHPLFTFVRGIRSKPDFSNPRRAVFVEVKYLRKTGGKSNLQTTIDGVLADIAKYRTASDLALFLLYDPEHLIKEPTRFVAQLEPKAAALIRVL